MALAPITEVLDTIDRAREHGDLDPGFQAVADQLERVVSGLGLTKFGEVGEPFDPRIHEALSHIGEDPEVEVTTCKVVAKAGYRIGDRVVRAAQVLVVDPPSGPTEQPPTEEAPAEQPPSDETGAD
jgi:molecular chaperone GrpE